MLASFPVVKYLLTRTTNYLKPPLHLPVSEHLSFYFPSQSIDFSQASQLQDRSVPFLTVSKTQITT